MPEHPGTLVDSSVLLDVSTQDPVWFAASPDSSPERLREYRRRGGARTSPLPDFTREPGTARMRAFLETKTVWHPTGAVSLAGGSGY